MLELEMIQVSVIKVIHDRSAHYLYLYHMLMSISELPLKICDDDNLAILEVC